MIDRLAHTTEVSHHRTHHAARKTTGEQQRGHHLVAGVDEVAEPLIDELLRHGTGLHVSVHIDVWHIEVSMLQHALHRNNIRMNLTPSQRLNSGIDNISTILTDLENRSHRQTWTRVAMILDKNIRMLCLNTFRELTEECRLTNTSHILQADLLCTGSDLFISKFLIVVECMNRRGRDAQCSLRGHATFLCPLDRRSNIADIVQAIEDTRDIRALCMLDTIHHLTHIVRHRIHAESIQATVQHVSLDTSLVERGCESTNGLVRILACKELHLLKGTAIGLNAREATHLDKHRSYLGKLVGTRLKLTAALPHVTIDKTELNLFLHI